MREKNTSDGSLHSAWAGEASWLATALFRLRTRVDALLAAAARAALEADVESLVPLPSPEAAARERVRRAYIAVGRLC